MQINVIAQMANLCVPIRNQMEMTGYSHKLVLDACNAHLGRIKGEHKGDDKRSDGKANVKKDSFKMSVQPGRVVFTSTFDVVGQFIAWHDLIAKAHTMAAMDTVPIPSQFLEWMKFAKATKEIPVEVK